MQTTILNAFYYLLNVQNMVNIKTLTEEPC